MSFPWFRRKSGSVPGKTVRHTDADLFAEVVARARDGQPIGDIAQVASEREIEALANALAGLREAKVEIESRDAESMAFSIDGVKSLAAAGADRLTAIGIGASLELDAINARLTEAKAIYRAYLAQKGLTPGKVLPVRMVPMVLISAFLVAEGLLTGSVFYQSGVVPTLAAGATLGVMASGAAVLLSAVIGGHLIGRYFSYAECAPVPNASDTRKRWLARIAAPLVGGSILLLHGSLATARAEGTLDGALLTFITNPLTAFGSLQSCLLFIFGIGGSVLAWVEGMSAFGDPDPGRERAYARSVDSAERDKDDAYADGLAEIDETEEKYLTLIDEAVEPVFGSSDGRAERVAQFEADKAALADAALDAITAIDASHDHIVGVYSSIAGKNPPSFRRVDTDAIRTRFRVDWSPPDNPARDVQADIERSRTTISTAADEARALITMSFYGTNHEEEK